MRGEEGEEDTLAGLAVLIEDFGMGVDGTVGVMRLGVGSPGQKPGPRGLIFRISMNTRDVADSGRSCGVVGPCTGCAIIS